MQLLILEHHHQFICLRRQLKEVGISETPHRLDLFPLNTVLLPGSVLPLHIFEPRYMAMTERCMRESRPFGIVLITDGDEVGDPDTSFCSMGTACEIIDCQEGPGRTRDIRVLGRKRFRIRRMLQTDPSGVADVTWVPWGDPSPAGCDRTRQLQRDFTRYWHLLMRLGGFYRSQPDLGDDALGTALTIAANLVIPPARRQLLLDAPLIDDLLETCAELLERATDDLQRQFDARQKRRSN